MRMILSMDLPDVQPSSVQAVRPTFLDVDPKSLLVDDLYQRDLTLKSVTLIRRIVAEWSWSAFKPPVCVAGDGGLHVIDGQHTAIAAATHPDIDTIPIMMVEAGEIADRADAFVRHNRDRIAVRATDLHFAMVAAGNDDAVTIAQVCGRAGVKILRLPPSMGRFRVGETMAVDTIGALIDRRHAMGARRVLETAVKGGAAPVSQALIRAIERLLYEQEYAGEITEEDIASVLLAGHDLTLEAKRFSVEHKVPTWKALASIIYMKRRRRRG